MKNEDKSINLLPILSEILPEIILAGTNVKPEAIINKDDEYGGMESFLTKNNVKNGYIKLPIERTKLTMATLYTSFDRFLYELNIF